MTASKEDIEARSDSINGCTIASGGQRCAGMQKDTEKDVKFVSRVSRIRAESREYRYQSKHRTE